MAEERTPARTYKHKTLLSEITQSASKSKAHTSAEDTKRRLRSIPIRRFPKLLEERVSEISSRSLAATDLKQDLRRMKTERATITKENVTDFTILNKSRLMTPDEKSKSIQKRAAVDSDRRAQVIEQAEQRKALLAKTAQQQLEQRESTHARNESQLMQCNWITAVISGARMSLLDESLQLSRLVRSLSEPFPRERIVFIQNKWRCYVARQVAARRAGARRVICRVLTSWAGRLRLRRRRKHAGVLLVFLAESLTQTQLTLKKAVLRHNHLIRLVQRRVRGSNRIWAARAEVAEMQFQCVQEQMLKKKQEVRVEPYGDASERQIRANNESLWSRYVAPNQGSLERKIYHQLAAQRHNGVCMLDLCRSIWPCVTISRTPRSKPLPCPKRAQMPAMSIGDAAVGARSASGHSDKRSMTDAACLINRSLANAGVRTIPRCASAAEARRVLTKNLRTRKENHESAVLHWFKARSNALGQARINAPIEWARAMMQGSKDLGFDQFLREQLHQAVVSLIRPVFRAAIPTVQMAALVQAAVGQTCPRPGARWT